VPQDFTLAFEVTGLAGGDTAGLELFSSPTVGQNNGDYWYHVDNDNNGWQLNGLAGTETGFGAEFEGSVLFPNPARMAQLPGLVAGIMQPARLAATPPQCLKAQQFRTLPQRQGFQVRLGRASPGFPEIEPNQFGNISEFTRLTTRLSPGFLMSAFYWAISR